jgi:hypothetical protein
VKFFELVGLEIFPVVFANWVVQLAGGVRRYFDVAADQLLNVVAGDTVKGARKMRDIDSLADKIMDRLGRRTVESSERARKVSSGSLQRYLAAAVIGFIMLIILILVSVGV